MRSNILACAGTSQPQLSSARPVSPFSAHQNGRPGVAAQACATLNRPTVSPHADAVKRRLEFEAMLIKRQADRSTHVAQEKAGVKWWQGGMPDNMHTVTTRSAFEDALAQAAPGDGLVVVKFFTESCYTCRSLQPKVKKLATQHPEVTILEVNGSPQEMQPLFEEQGIKHVPLFRLYKHGAMVSEFTASLNPEKLAKLRLEVKEHA